MAPDAFAAHPSGASWAAPPTAEQRSALRAALASTLAAQGAVLAAAGHHSAAPGPLRFTVPSDSPAAQALGQLLDSGSGALSVSVSGTTAHVPVRRASRGALPPRCLRVVIANLPTTPLFAVEGVTAEVLRCAGYEVGDPLSAQPQPGAALVLCERAGKVKGQAGACDPSVVVAEVLPPAGDAWLERLPLGFQLRGGGRWVRTLVHRDPVAQPEPATATAPTPSGAAPAEGATPAGVAHAPMDMDLGPQQGDAVHEHHPPHMAAMAPPSPAPSALGPGVAPPLQPSPHAGWSSLCVGLGVGLAAAHAFAAAVGPLVRAIIRGELERMTRDAAGCAAAAPPAAPAASCQPGGVFPPDAGGPPDAAAGPPVLG